MGHIRAGLDRNVPISKTGWWCDQPVAATHLGRRIFRLGIRTRRAIRIYKLVSALLRRLVTSDLHILYTVVRPRKMM